MRVFVAISPPESTRTEIGQVIAGLRKDFPQVKWEDPEKIHLTLAFLGMLAEEKVNTLKDILRDVTPNFNSFELEISGASYFYKKHDDSIIYLDVIDRSGELKNFYRTLKRTLVARDIFLPDRIDPHITIGRVKRVRKVHVVKDTLVEVARTEIPPIASFKVSSANVYHSMFSGDNDSFNYRLLQASRFSVPNESPDETPDESS